MCPYIPPGITAAARLLRSKSSVRTFSRLVMSATVWLPLCSDDFPCDRLDSGRVEPVAVVERGGRPDHDVLVRHAVPTECDAGAGFRQHLRDSGTQAAGDVVLLDGQHSSGLLGRGEDLLAIERIDRVHVEDTSLDAVHRQAVGGVEAGAYLGAGGDDREIPALPEA